MGGENDDAVFLARKANDEVAHVHRPDWGIGGECVFFELIVLEMSAQEFFGLGVPWTRWPARSDGREFARVFVGFSAIEVLWRWADAAYGDATGTGHDGYARTRSHVSGIETAWGTL